MTENTPAAGVRRWRRPLIALGVAALVTVLIAALPRDNAAEGWVADRTVAARAAMFGARPLNNAKVVVVGLDQLSLTADDPLLARPRALFTPVYRELITKALSHGARGVALDFILAYDASTLTVGEERPLKKYDNPFLGLLRKESKGQGRVIVGTSAKLSPARKIERMAGPGGLGLVELPVRAGNVIQTVPPFMVARDGSELPTISGLARILLGDAGRDAIEVLPPAPLDTLPSAALIDVRQCEDSARLSALFDGRIVLLGSMLQDEDRLKFTDRLMARKQLVPRPADADPCAFHPPIARAQGAESLPGVYAHASAIDAALSGWAPRPAGRSVVIALICILGFVAALFSLLVRPVLGGLVVVSVTALAFFSGVVGLESGVYLPSAGPMMAGLGAFGVSWGVRLGLLDREANATRRAFGRYLSPVLVRQMIETGETPKLGGEPRDVSVLFADLSGFTATSEKMESDALTALVNRYLDRIDRVIQAHGGYVDKFIGDAVMAIFNAPARIPDHAKASVDAAHEILHVVEEEAVRDREKGLPGFSIKVGISSGPATVGNVGSRKRLNYTVIGDTVNQAARFESLPSLFKTPIVIGPETARRIEIEYELLPIVSIQVKGKSDGLQVFAPMALRGTLDDHTMDRLDDYAIALKAFEEGKFDTAAALWDDLAAQDWPGAEMAGAMADEARYTSNLPLPDGWNGVLEARGK